VSGATDTSGRSLGVVQDPTPEELHKAALAVALGYGDGHLDADQARDVLEMIGVVPYESGGRYLPHGERVSATAKRDRRRVPQRARKDTQTPKPTQRHQPNPPRAAQNESDGIPGPSQEDA